MSCAYPSVEIQIDELAEFVFKTNKMDAVVELSLGGIEDNKDLFYFCLDLFCKGLVLLHGKGDNTLIVNDITMEQFDVIKRKMKNAGIEVTLNVITSPGDSGHAATPVEYDLQDDCNPPTDLPVEALYPNVNIDEVEMLPGNLDLKDYKFEIHLSPQMTYSISFELFHRVV